MSSEPSIEDHYILPPEGVRLSHDDVRRLLEDPSLETNVKTATI